MTREFKLDSIKLQLGISDNSADDLVDNYLTLAEQEILAWLYQMVGAIPDGATIPPTYDVISISAVVEGYSHSGAEGETTHKENGIDRVFKYEDMIGYIHAHVYPYIGVVG